MVGKNIRKYSHYLALGCIATVWAVSTAVSTHYSHIEWNEKFNARANDLAYKIENYLDLYQDLMVSMFAMYESDKTLSADETENFFKSWSAHSAEKIPEDSVRAMGWYDLNSPESSYFFQIGSRSEALKFTPLRNAPRPTMNSGLNVTRDGAFLTHKDAGNHIVLSLYLAETAEKNPGWIFAILDTDKIDRQIQTLFLSADGNIDLAIDWFPTSHNAYENAENHYTHHLPFGSHELHLRFNHNSRWSFFSDDNILGMATALFGFLFTVLFFFYLKALSEKSYHSEIARDDAERKLVEQANFYEKIVENLPAILFIKDAKDDFKYYMFNKAAESFFGYSRHDMIGRSDAEFFNEEEAGFFRAMDEATMMGKRVIDIPCEVVTTASAEAFVHTRKIPIYDSNGDPQYLVGMSEDITKRKKYEMELAEYRQNLENMVEERTNKLKLAMTKAEEASRLKSEFLATMSHEIRSPMSGVLGMAELLLDTPLTIEQRGLTKTILNSGEVLLNIIEDILDFSKIEANKLELDPIAVNMLELVDDVSLLYSSRARDKALELVVYYTPGSEQFVYADPTRIRQVLGNLLNNAIKFTQKGHIVVKVSEEKSDLLPEDKVMLSFSIEDTGIGIDEKDREKIFEKFSQANSSTTRNYGGTGLGLSICKKLIEMMGGQISVESTPGKGSIFSFTLPMTRNREESFVQPKPPILENCRILIVDDLPIIRHMLCEQLSMAGMRCDCAASGQAALTLLMEARENDLHYDMIIIDYLMPGMNGEMLARAINDEPAFRDICLIMLTAAGNPLLGDDFGEKGFSAYISKPVRATNLIYSLSVIWEKYKNGYKDTLIRVDTAGLGSVREEETDLRLEGARILLVEDSRLNQAFAEEVLAQLACDVTTVSNGQEAVDIVERKPFDLILMDCQMPIMDGFEAARRIAALKKEGKVSAALPILALTANAMKGDRQRCLDAGMDDYITKPVRKKELKEKIYYWIKRESSDAHGTLHEGDAMDDAQQAHMDILDKEMLAEAKALLKDKFDFLLGCYIDDVEAYIREIQDAMANKNIEAVVLPAHTIKSTSKRMGAMMLSDIAKDIELAARDAANANSIDAQIVDDVRRLSATFEETRKKLIGA